ncbi:hypothetical protein JXZ93_01855 [Mycoplasma sp. CSL10166]|nr:hypothetical protein [Mycoplasma sp. CSL10166]
MKIMARQYFNKKHYIIDEEKRVVILLPEFYNQLRTFDKWKGYKKIGGSSVGDILTPGRFKSEFNAFCHITRLKIPVLSKKYINAGTILEPKIFDIFRNSPQVKKRGITIENYVASEYDYDYFKNVDDVLSGVPDGFDPINKVIYEVKTAGEAKKEKWDNEGVDPSYLKQAQLYTYLMSKKIGQNVDFYSILVAFLSDEKGDYLDPANVDLNQRYMKVYSRKVNKVEVEDDIRIVREWYKKYTNTDTSPQFDFSNDADQLDFLRCENQEQYQELIKKWKDSGKADSDFIG